MNYLKFGLCVRRTLKDQIIKFLNYYFKVLYFDEDRSAIIKSLILPCIIYFRKKSPLKENLKLRYFFLFGLLGSELWS